eukprot:Pgem_evm1s18100
MQNPLNQEAIDKYVIGQKVRADFGEELPTADSFKPVVNDLNIPESELENIYKAYGGFVMLQEICGKLK